jgi:hypothetical protein
MTTMMPIVVTELERQSRADLRGDLHDADRQQHAPEAARAQAVGEIGDEVASQDPHRQEVPLQGALWSGAHRHPSWKMQPAEDYFVVVDCPPAHDHDDHRYRVDPMHEA